MMTWPDNKRIAVMMAFDLDAETMWTTRGDGNHDHITNLSRGAYGPKQGVPRILEIMMQTFANIHAKAMKREGEK